MSKVHVLSARGQEYRVVLHTAMPAGSNSAGKTWVSCWVAAGRNVSVLTEGTGPGQISTAELAQVVAGSVIEIQATLRLTSGGATQASVDAMANSEITTALARLQEEYAYYGHTQD